MKPCAICGEPVGDAAAVCHAECAEAKKEGLRVAALCETNSLAYWAYQEMGSWMVGSCVYIGACTDGGHVISATHTFKGEIFWSLRRWLYVFASEDEAKAFAMNRVKETAYLSPRG